MKTLRHIIVVASLLFASFPLMAQWTGSVDAAFGYGWMRGQDGDDDPALKHGLGEGGARITYSSTKFQWNLNVRGSYEDRTSDSYRVSFSGISREDIPLTLDAISQFSDNGKGIGVIRSDLRWTPAAGRTYEAWFQYGFQIDDATHTTFKEGIDIEDSDIDEIDRIDLYLEVAKTIDQRGMAGIRAARQLDGPKKVLYWDLSFDDNYKDRHSEWLNMDASSDNINGGIYRLTPRTDTRTLSGIVHFTDSIRIRRPAKLMIDPGLRIISNQSLDHNRGATLIDMDKNEWRDSTRLREDFNFLALTVEPYLAANMTWDRFQVHVDYAPQMYSRRLTDDTHKQRLKLRPPHPVGNGFISWNVSPSHRLTLRNRLEVRHPDYIQICWYERQGAYMNQIYRGKEKLRSIGIHTYSLDYEFRYRRFLATTGLAYVRRTNEIDQTFTNEMIEGREYQVFTWVNASHSHSTSISEQLGWRSERLNANVGITYNGTRRTSSETGETRLSTDWKAWADASLSLPHGWTMGANVNYRSDVATFFTIFKQYCTLNARIQKRFGKVIVFIQGRDLLDNKIEREYTSADFNEMWVETTRNNRRIVMLGMQWGF